MNHGCGWRLGGAGLLVGALGLVGACAAYPFEVTDAGYALLAAAMLSGVLGFAALPALVVGPLLLALGPFVAPDPSAPRPPDPRRRTLTAWFLFSLAAVLWIALFVGLTTLGPLIWEGEEFGALLGWLIAWSWGGSIALVLALAIRWVLHRPGGDPAR